MVKTNERPSKKACELNVENINEEIEGESDHEKFDKRANSKNAGLP